MSCHVNTTVIPPSRFQVKGRYSPGGVAIHCEGEYVADQENMGELEYLPSQGLEKKFFPYRFLDNFHQPIAMVKFNGPRTVSPRITQSTARTLML